MSYLPKGLQPVDYFQYLSSRQRREIVLEIRKALVKCQRIFPTEEALAEKYGVGLHTIERVWHDYLVSGQRLPTAKQL